MGEHEVFLEEEDGFMTVHHRHKFKRAGVFIVSCTYTYPDGKSCMLKNVAMGSQLPSWEFRVIAGALVDH